MYWAVIFNSKLDYCNVCYREVWRSDSPSGMKCFIQESTEVVSSATVVTQCSTPYRVTTQKTTACVGHLWSGLEGGGEGGEKGDNGRWKVIPFQPPLTSYIMLWAGIDWSLKIIRPLFQVSNNIILRPQNLANNLIYVVALLQILHLNYSPRLPDFDIYTSFKY